MEQSDAAEGNAWRRVRLSEAVAWGTVAGAVAAAPFLILEPAAAAAAWLMGWVLVLIARIDLTHMVVYDALSLPLIPAGLLATWIFDPVMLPAHTAACVVAPAAVWLVASTYRLLRGRDGLGSGDLRLLAVAGAWVGPSGLPVVLLLASCLGLLTAGVLARRGGLGWHGRIPFAPALAGATWLVFVFPDIARW